VVNSVPSGNKLIDGCTCTTAGSLEVSANETPPTGAEADSLSRRVCCAP